MNNIAGKRVLISPLDWGLGHAARCIPIIRNLLDNSNEVFVYAPTHLQLYFAERFPKLSFITDSSASFEYGITGFSTAQLIQAAFKLKKQIGQEQKICNELYNRLSPDFIISDNRYGFFDPKAYSILITHQLRPVIPKPLHIFKSLVYSFLDRFHHSFSEIWIPDFPNEPQLAGKLSHPGKKIKNANYIGILSRFERLEYHFQKTEPNTVLIITSGPERHRREMANRLLNNMQSEAIVIIVGVDNHINPDGHINFIKSPTDIELNQYILKSEIIISCFGYSTFMDLITLNRSAILVPTKGQTEQEYLAQMNGELMVTASSWDEIGRLLLNKDKLLENLSKNQEKIKRLNQLKFEKK